MRGQLRAAPIRPLPCSPPRRELLLLALVALATFTVVQPPNTQDRSRLCLTRALVSGHVFADRCIATSETEDRAVHGGHLYTDKAPGLSVAEVVPAELVRLPAPAPGAWDPKGDLRLWLVHLLATGVPFLTCVFLIGRISEGLAPGYGGAALVVFALGTEMGALGISGFDHVLTGTLSLVAFLLAWTRRPLAAGLVCGLAVTTEYEAGAILIVLLAYVAREGVGAAGRYVVGALPGLALLGAYDWAAFGAPWHASYRYLGNALRSRQQSGLLGVRLPTLHGLWEVFVGDRGLLLAAPVLVGAAFGLGLLWRAGFRAEASVCVLIVIGFIVADCGYFQPYGGRSPGPRFLAASLPFLALGLGPAFLRWPRAMAWLTVPSVVASTALALTWPPVAHYRQSIWGEIARIAAQGGSSRLMYDLPRNVLAWNLNRIAGGVIVGCFAAAAVAIALVPKVHAARGIRRSVS